jgi:hypothetical protein
MYATERFSVLRRTFASFFARSWSDVRIPKVSQAIAAMLGLAGPIVVGAMVGHARIGMVASLGGLALSGEGKGVTFHEQAHGLIYALIAGSVAMLAGSGIAGHGMITATATVVVVAAAGLLGSISRPLARAATLFMLFTIIAANLGAGETSPLAIMLLFFLGAAWTAGLSLVLRPLFQALHLTGIPNNRANVAPGPKYSAGQLLRRWRKSLTHLSGWQYMLRIVLCLVVGLGFEWIWPHHHGYWVFITVVIVVQHNLEAVLKRTFHRAAGTMLGVFLTSLLLLGSPTIWIVIAMITALAASRPILREIDYVAYAAIQTPLVILLLDFGRTPSWTAIIDRLVATLVGCILALTLGYLGWSRLSPSARLPHP